MALSEVAPIDLSHDAISYWLKVVTLKHAEIYKKTKNLMGDKKVFSSLMIPFWISTAVNALNWSTHNIPEILMVLLNGISMVNAIWYNSENKDYIPVYFRAFTINRAMEKPKMITLEKC